MSDTNAIVALEEIRKVLGLRQTASPYEIAREVKRLAASVAPKDDPPPELDRPEKELVMHGMAELDEPVPVPLAAPSPIVLPSLVHKPAPPPERVLSAKVEAKEEVQPYLQRAARLQMIRDAARRAEG